MYRVTLRVTLNGRLNISNYNISKEYQDTENVFKILKYSIKMVLENDCDGRKHLNNSRNMNLE